MFSYHQSVIGGEHPLRTGGSPYEVQKVMLQVQGRASETALVSKYRFLFCITFFRGGVGGPPTPYPSHQGHFTHRLVHTTH